MEAFLQGSLVNLLIGGIILINVIVWSFVIGRAVIRRRLHSSAWRAFAGRMGLTFKKGGLFSTPAVNGEYRGRMINVSIFHRTRSGYSSTVTQLTVSIRNEHFHKLQIDRAGGLLGAMGNVVLGKDIQTGDHDFDRSMSIRGEPEEMIRDVLSDSMLRAGLKEMKRRGSLVLGQSSHEIVYKQERLERNADYLAGLLGAVCDLADKIEGWTPPPGYGIERVGG